MRADAGSKKFGKGLLSGLSQAAVAASTKPKVRKRPPVRKPAARPLPSSFGPISKQKPLETAQAAAKAKTQKARKAIPNRPAPRVPYIVGPTKQQQRATTKVLVKAVKTGVLTKDLRPTDPSDPVQRELARAAAHYGRVSKNQVLHHIGAEAALKLPVVPRPASRPAGMTILKALSDLTDQRGPRQRVIDYGQGQVDAKNLRDGSLHERVKPKHEVGIPGFEMLGSINLAPLEHDAAGFISKHTSLDTGDSGPKRLVKNLLSDAAQLGEGVPLGLLHLAGAGFSAGIDPVSLGVRALTGQSLKPNLGPAGDLVKVTAEALAQDPLVQLGGAALGIKGASVQGAKESFSAHPGFALLDAYGAAGVAGRGAGALARGVGKAEATGVRGALARVGDTRRSPIGLMDDAGLARRGYVKERRGSKNPINRFLQNQADAVREARHGFIEDAHGKPVLVNQRGKMVPVFKPKGKSGPQATFRDREFGRNEGRKLQNQRADFLASQGHSIEVNERHIADAELHQAERAGGGRGPTTPGRKTGLLPDLEGHVAEKISQLVATGTVLTKGSMAKNLRARAAQIEHELEHNRKDYGTRTEVKNAKALASMLRAAADDPKILKQADAIERVGLAHAKNLNADEAKSIERNIIEEPRAKRARLSEVALAHMNARHHSVEQHTKLEKAALREEHTAKAALDAAPPHLREQAAREYALAKERRIAVSGREPSRVVAHERARDEHGAAVAKVDEAQAAFTKADDAVKRMQAVQASERMKGSQPGARKAHPREEAALARRTAVRDAARERLKAAEDASYKAKDILGKNPLPDIEAAIRNADGSFLSNKHIEDFLREQGRDPDTVAYLPHLEALRGARSFHKQNRPGTRPTTPDEARKGTLYRRGGNAVGTELVREEMTHKKTAVAKAEVLDKQVSESGMLHPQFDELKERFDAQQREREAAYARDERYVVPAEERLTKLERAIVRSGGRYTGAESLEFVKKLADEGVDVVAVREFSTKLSRELQDGVRSQHNPRAMETAHLKMLQDRVVTDGAASSARNVVLMPAHEYNRMIAHLQPAGAVEKLVQSLNAPFRMAVLPQPRWLTGNFVEPYLVRLPLSGAGLNLFGAAADVVAARKLVNRLERSGDPAKVAQGKALRTQLGGLFVGRRGAAVRRTYEDFDPSTQAPARAVFAAAHVVRNLPVFKQMGDLVLAVPKTFFNVNRVIESGAQYQALGKSIRSDIQEFQGSWLATIKLTEDVMAQVEKGSAGTSTMQRWMKEQHDLLGKYEGFNPTTRRLIQTFMPFLPWSLASARFVWWTMPVHHPAVTALLLKMSQSNQDQWAKDHEDVPPGSLKAAIKRKDGGLVDVARYTQWGFSVPLVEGDYKGITDTLLPTLSGVIKALEGKDPFGRDLVVEKTKANPKGQPSKIQQLEIAVNTGLEALVPLLAMARRLQEGGGTPYADSTVLSPKTKPGSSRMGAIERTLSPARPVYLKKPKKKGGGGVSAAPGWGGSGGSSSSRSSAPGWGG